MTDLWNWIIVNRLKLSSADTALLCTFGSTVRPDSTALFFVPFSSFLYPRCIPSTYLKYVIVFLFGNQISKWRSFEKGLFLTYFSRFSVTREKTQKKSSAHIPLVYIHVLCSPYWPFLPYQFRKNFEFIMYGFSLVRLLVLILNRAILEQSINNIMGRKI